jgi:hypothetical protein
MECEGIEKTLYQKWPEMDEVFLSKRLICLHLPSLYIKNLQRVEGPP